MELNTNSHRATYEMKISGFDLDTSTNKVYGVVLTTADGVYVLPVSVAL